MEIENKNSEAKNKDNFDDHEIIFWKSCANKLDSEWGDNFRHLDFYKSFFDFDQVTGSLLEIGCGGMPIDTYLNKDDNNTLDKSKIDSFHIVDPIINDLIKIKEYEYLKKYSYHSCSILDFDIDKKFDSIVCLNMLDHMESGHFDFFKKIYSMLNKNGSIFIYFDQRSKYSKGHYVVEDFEKIKNFISFYFNVKNESLEVNPRHKNWGNVTFSYRLFAVKA